MSSAHFYDCEQVFDLLWRLISHDIWFVWERLEYLQHEDGDIITMVPFQVRFSLSLFSYFPSLFHFSNSHLDKQDKCTS